MTANANELPRGARKAGWPLAAARTYPQAARISHAGRRAEFKLGAKVLAATLAACAKDLAATRCLLACKETVAPRAYQIAGLKSPLHFILEKSKYGALDSAGLARLKRQK